MYMLDPELLAEARGLPLTISVAGLVLGLLLWCFGWWGHRFWIVLGTTAAAGIVGLSAGPVSGLQPLVVALLLAVAAGALALHLSRLVVFAWTGLGVWLCVHAVIPALNEPLICFLIGGLFGLLLFRFWTMVLTSFSGSLLIGYCTLLIVEKYSSKFPAGEWATDNAGWLNIAVGGVILLGWLTQFLVERLRLQYQLKKQEEEEKTRLKEKEKQKEKERAEKSKKRSWWDWAAHQLKKAG